MHRIFLTLNKNSLSQNIMNFLQVDLTAYVERHEFVFDAVLNQHVSNDEVRYFIIYMHKKMNDHS